ALVDAGDVVVAARLGDGVEAAEVEDEAVSVAHLELVEPGDVAEDQTGRDLGRGRFGLRQADGARDEVDRGDVPAVLGHVDGVRAGAAAEVEGLAGSAGVRAFDELAELGGRDAGVPGREAEPVHGAEDEAHLRTELSPTL